jgi:hypothetical protein
MSLRRALMQTLSVAEGSAFDAVENIHNVVAEKEI